jgi:NADH-quinone oxidoreductase subunit M
MLPDAAAVCTPWVLWLSVVGIIYGALVALAQSDIKRLIAYSSVSHLGFCMLGVFALNKLGLEGGVLQMINHGLSTGGLFAIVGMIYERYHTREISKLGGLARRTPLLAFFMLLFTLSSIGLPGLNGFAGEFLLLLGMFQRGWGAGQAGAIAPQLQAIAVIAVLGVVLGAWYMLWLVQRVFFGPLREPADHHANGHQAHVRDMSLREVLALAPLVVFMFWIGLQPRVFLDPMRPSLTPVLARTSAAFEQRYAVGSGEGQGVLAAVPHPNPLPKGEGTRQPPSPGTPGEGRGEGPRLSADLREHVVPADDAAPALTLTLSRSTGRGDQTAPLPDS